MIHPGMRGRVTYIFHNCFLLDIGGRTLLFDCPEGKYLKRRAAEALSRKLEGRRVTAFVSHSHDDHFRQDLAVACAGAASADFVVSDDVAEMYPAAVPTGARVVGPDEVYSFSGLVIETLMSNDLGVAYLVEVSGARVYFGGDLAAWVWETAAEAEQAFTAEFFTRALERIARRPVDIAFTNVDRRLANLAGGPEFARTVRPRLLVPMHAFGRTAWLKEARPLLTAGGSDVFIYDKPGQTLELDLEPSGNPT